MSYNNPAVLSEGYLRRILNKLQHLENVIGAGTRQEYAIEADCVTIELAGEWSRIDGGETAWCCDGKLVLFDEESRQFRTTSNTVKVVSPFQDEPAARESERVTAVWRTGHWELVSGPSSSTPAALSGVVVEAIAPGRAGRVRIYGRNYPTTDSDGNPIEPVYDLIICDELAVAQNEFPEQLLPGTVLADIRGPFRRPKQGGNDNETESYYVAVNTEGVYTGILATDVTGPDAESTVQIRDRNGNLTTMTIHSYYIAGVQTIGAGTGVMVARQQTDGGLRLVIVKSRYAVTLTEPPT